MKKNVFRKFVYGFMGLTAFFLLMPSTFAIGIRPLRNEVSAKPGESIEGEVTVVNETGKDIVAEPIVQVFYQNDETGLPIYLTREEQLKQNRIEDFLSWIHISNDQIPVPARGTVTVPYTVNVPKKAIAGGKYATIAFQPVKEPSEGISINVRAASLLYVNVEGRIIRSGVLTYFGLPKKPVDGQSFVFDVSFSNTGNIHLKPTGWIELTNLETGKKLTGIAEYMDPVSGEKVISDKIPINFNKGNVLPGSLRTFKAEWTRNLKIGKYRADLSLAYADDATPITKSFEFAIERGLVVDSFTVNPSQESADFSLTVSNRSQTYEKLRGAIAISDPFGFQVAKVTLPEDIDYIAPGTTRSFSLNWADKDVLKDRFTAKLNATYGFTNETLSAKVSFGEVNRTKLFLGIGLLVVGALIAVGALISKGKGRKRGKRKKR